jgi:hypothetical protein
MAWTITSSSKFFFLFVFLRQSLYVAQTGLKLMFPLPSAGITGEVKHLSWQFFLILKKNWEVKAGGL